jgi:excisionase family DNA binding protein
MPAEVLTSDDLTAALAPILEELAYLKAATPSRLTTSQACEFLNVSPKTLKRMRDDGRLKGAEKPGHSVFYDRNELIAYRKSKGISPEYIALQIAS